MKYELLLSFVLEIIFINNNITNSLTIFFQFKFPKFLWCLDNNLFNINFCNK